MSAAKSIFGQALAIEAAAERAAFLERACGGDAGLRVEVEGLLAALAGAGDFLARPAADLGPTVDPEPRDNVGLQVGPYKLLQKLGEGGMGAVWVAEQHEPVKRRVALKLIKPGMDSAQVLRRFEAERQALALMAHTHIAKVFDAGKTELGRPYFVMELVHGVPITKYCDELNLPIRERLALFVPVCQAIQHAHQKGVLHRDIKPGNVLVCMQDGKPMAKVIDFGVAKALHQKLTDETMMTEFGAVVGTLEYMSPEQAEMSPLGVDTRADVYSLGVLLYQLLTGTTPLDRKRLRSAAYGEMLRIIREVEPPKPSTRLTESKEMLASVAAQRRTDPARLAKEVRGDLDWIVMRCLEKDRTRRYETANGLARDVERHLADEPVEACPPSAGYRLGKFVRRNRAGLAVAGGILLLTYVGACGVYLAYRRAVAAEVQAREQEGKAVAAARAEGEEKHKAQEAEADTRAFAEFLANHVLAATRPEGVQDGVGVNVTMAEALAKAEPALGKVFKGRPRAEALARHEIGVTWRNLGRHAEAIRHLERACALRREALGEDDPKTLESMNSLSVAYCVAGKLKDALALKIRVVAAAKLQLTEDQPDLLVYMAGLGTLYGHVGDQGRAIAILEEVVARSKKKLGEDDPQTLEMMTSLGVAYCAAGKLDKALPLVKEALSRSTRTLGEDHPQTLTCLHTLARVHNAARRFSEALPLYERSLEMRRRKLGENNPETLTSLKELGAAYLDAGKVERALPLLRQALASRTKVLGPDHLDTLKSMNTLAVAYAASGEKEKALPLVEQALAKNRQVLPEAHPEILTSLANLAWLYRNTGKPDRAVPLYEEWLTRKRAQAAEDNLEVVAYTANLGLACLEAKKPEKALPLLHQFLAAQKKRLAATPAQFGALQASIASELLKAGQPAEAEQLLRESLAAREKAEPASWTTFNTRSMLGESLLGQRKYADAEPLLLQGYEGLKKAEAKIPPQARGRLSEAVGRLVRLYDATGKNGEAAKWRKELEATKSDAK
ncbi:MAG: tetratricopeptide repeat protein [Gemmataceae bacterium]